MRAISLTIIIVLAASVLSAQAALDGKWEAKFRSNPQATEQTITFVFKTQGNAVTGTVASPRGGEVAIEEGRLNGDTLTFMQTLSNPRGSTVFRYTGKINGDEITLTRLGARGGGPQSMTAKRVE